MKKIELYRYVYVISVGYDTINVFDIEKYLM